MKLILLIMMIIINLTYAISIINLNETIESIGQYCSNIHISSHNAHKRIDKLDDLFNEQHGDEYITFTIKED